MIASNSVKRSAYLAFAAAEDAWTAEVNARYPKVIDARYLPIAKGVPGQVLYRLYHKRRVAMAAWEKACGLGQRAGS